MVDFQAKLLQRIDTLPGEVVKAALVSWMRQSDMNSGTNFTPLQEALDEQEALIKVHDAIVASPEFLEAFPPQTEEAIVAECEARWQQFKETGHAVDHADVGQWVASLGTDNPLPCPQ